MQSLGEEQLIQSSDEAVGLHHAPDGQQCPDSVRLRSSTGVVANGQTLVGEAEDRLEGDDEAGQANGMDLRPTDGGATCLRSPCVSSSDTASSDTATSPMLSASSRVVPLSASTFEALA